MRHILATLGLLLAPTASRAAALWSVNGATVTTASSDQIIGAVQGSAAPDTAGGMYVVWADSRNFATTGMNVYAQHLDVNGAPVAGWPANGLQINNTVSGTCANAVGARNSYCPGVSGDGAGGAFIVWQDWRSGNPQVYAQRVKPDGTIVWTANGVLADTSPNGSDQGGGPFLADDGSLFVLFYDSAPLAAGGLNFRVQKLAFADGSQLFGSEGRVISSTTIQSYKYVDLPVTDGANGFYVAWSDTRSNTVKPYAARVDASGNKQWEIVLSSAANDQGFYLDTTADGSGGLYAVWGDSRAGNGQVDVYGTHVLNTGAPAAGWSTGTQGGNPIAVGAPALKFLPLADSYAGDLVTVWEDLSGVHMRALVQRMGATTGQPVWTANGVGAFVPASATTDSLESTVIRVSSGNIFLGTGWVANNSSGGCPLCISEFPIGQAVNPSNGSPLFSVSSGVTLGVSEFNVLGVSAPRAYVAVRSTVDATTDIVWIAGMLGNTNLYAQKLSTAGGSGGGGGGGASATDLAPYLAVMASDTVIAQWTSVPGASYIAAISTGSAFTTVTASGTVASSFRSTYTALSPGTSYYFRVKLSTESDAGFVTTLSGLTAPAGISSQAYSTQWGSNGSGAGQFNAPDGIAVDRSGNLFVSDQGNNRVQKFDSNGVFISSWGGAGSGNGQFSGPLGIAVDGSGDVFVVDYGNNRVQKFDPSGNFLKKWGSVGSGNGQFLTAAGVAVDGSGNVYVTERGNARVQKFDTNGTFLAKWGSRGHGPGQFDSPYGIGVDGSGRVFVVDGSNGTDPLDHRVQRFDSNGSLQAVWSALGSAPGLLNSATHLAVDAAGNVYVADYFNNRVQEFDGNGRLLGTWGSIGNGNGQFVAVDGIAVDANGNVFTTDTSSDRVQRFGSNVLRAAPPAPTGVQFTFVSTDTLSLSWTLVSGSTYTMVLSTSASFASQVSSGTGALNQNTTSYFGLAPATYYFEVKVATNPDASYSAAVSTFVAGLPPPPAPSNVVTTEDSFDRLSLQWTLNPGSAYLMALAADSGFSAVVSSGLGGLNQNTTSYTGLAALSTYYFKVKVSTDPDASYSAPLTVFVPAPSPPQNVAFTAVSTTSLSVSWTLNSGSSYVMVLSSQSSFASTVSSGTGALNQNTTTYAIAQAGTYYFKVKLSSHPDAGYSAPISTTTGQPPGFTQATPISAATGGTVSLNPVTGPINFTIPAYAFGAADNTLTSSIPSVVPPASRGASGSVTPVGPAFDIKLANPVPSFPKPVKVDVTYAAPPAVNASLLRLAWYDDAFGVWWPIWESYYNAILGILTAYLTHNTTFAVVTVQSASSLDQLKVFPNPVNFSAAVRNTVKFSGLTRNATIKIYDMAGERVATLDPGLNAGGDVNDGVSGMAEWNGRNSSGSIVARGTYIYVITDPGGGRRTGKIGVVQ